MAVQVHLTFNSVDEAIVALGKMVLAKAPVVAAPVASPAPADKPARRARSDAGKERGSYKKDANATVEAGTDSTVGSGVADTAAAGKQADPTSTAASPAGASTSTPPAAAPAPAPATPKPVPSLEDVQSAVERLFNGKDFETCEGVLSRFGVRRGKDLAEDQRFDFIAKADRVLAGEAI